MKQTFTLIGIFIILAMSTNALAQIKLTSNDVYWKGNFTIGIDMLNSFDLGNAAGNQQWDYSNLDKDDSSQFVMASYNSSLNDANMVRVVDGDTFEYIQKEEDAIYSIIPTQNLDTIIFEKIKTHSFPLSYQDELLDSFTQVSYYRGSDLGIFNYDSIKVIFKYIQHTQADAWGTLKIPMGTFNVLRIKSVQNVDAKVFGKSGSSPYSPIPSLNSAEMISSFIWYTKEMGHFLAYYDVEYNEMSYLTKASLGVQQMQMEDIQISFNNPVQNTLIIQNNEAANIEVRLIDVQGSNCALDIVNRHSTVNMDVSAIAKGIYTIQMRNLETGGISTKKLIKN